MTIQLTAEQEQRVQAVMGRGGYRTAQEVVDAALIAVEHWGLDAPGTDEIDVLLVEGLASASLTDEQFWDSIHKQTDPLLAERTSQKQS
jgi:hypothetical protein